MFGYIKPYIPDLRVREHEMYRGLYCGLCRSMGKHTGQISRMTLSYDFVFLAAVRSVLSKDTVCPKLRRCMVHPLKKRACICDNTSLKYCAGAAALLTAAKLDDDIADSKGINKFMQKLLRPFVKLPLKKALKCESVPRDEVYSCLEKLSELEKSGCPSIDGPADLSGELLSAVFSCGLPEREARIAAVIGKSAGRYIYVMDAADDKEKDKKTGNYNPLNIENVEKEALSSAVRLELEKMEAAVNLMDFTGKPELEGIIKNIIYEGLPKNADALFGGKDIKHDRSL